MYCHEQCYETAEVGVDWGGSGNKITPQLAGNQTFHAGGSVTAPHLLSLTTILLFTSELRPV